MTKDDLDLSRGVVSVGSSVWCLAGIYYEKHQMVVPLVVMVVVKGEGEDK